MRPVESAESSLMSARYFEIASLILTPVSGLAAGVFAGAGDCTGTGAVESVQESLFSHWPAIAFASAHSQTPVDLRLKCPLRVPEAKIGQSQRFQFFFRSSNSPEQSLCARPAVQARL